MSKNKTEQKQTNKQNKINRARYGMHTCKSQHSEAGAGGLLESSRWKLTQATEKIPISQRNKPAKGVDAFNCSTQEAEAGKLGLHSQSQARQDYTVRPCLKINSQIKRERGPGYSRCGGNNVAKHGFKQMFRMRDPKPTSLSSRQEDLPEPARQAGSHCTN